MAKEIDDRAYYQVTGWMINDLHLSGQELICYAIIYSLSQLGQGLYKAGLDYLAKFMQCSQPTASKALKGLFGKHLIDKTEVTTERGRRVLYYCTNPDEKEGEKESYGGVNKNFMDGSIKDLYTHNNNINKEYNKKELFGNNSKKEAQFIEPTLEEIDAYIKEKGFHFDAEYFLSHYQSVGWKRGNNKIKDWKAACRYWEYGNKKKEYEPLSTDEDKVKRFKLWMREKHSGIEFCEKPLTFDGYMRLQREYGMDNVCNQLDYIDANIGKFKKCDIELVIKQYLDKQ